MLLKAENDMTVIGEAPDAVQGLKQVAHLQPDIVLMDISMPSGSGLDVVREMKQKSPYSLIVILTMHDDEGYLHMALAEGVSGYVLKQAANTDLLAAIRVVSHRATLFDEESEEHHRTKPGEEDDYNRLSTREKEILRLIAMGYTNRQSAEELYLSEKTIETYKSRLMHKLGLHTRIELVRYALRMGLIKS
jgi:two-component system, NarL family, response regulator NreC